MSFGEKLKGAFDKIRLAAVVDKDLVKEINRELQRALISADVPIDLVLELSKKVEQASIEKIPEGLSRKEHLLKKTHDFLIELLNPGKELPLRPEKILLIGLYGSGKTTSAGKLAKWFKRKGRRPLLVAADVDRPAAFEQLQQLSEKMFIPFFGEKQNKNAAQIVEHALENKKNADLIIVDSAGRSALDQNLIDELKQIKQTLNPDQIWLVLSSDIGQVAGKQAKAFHESVGVNGIIITKTDGSGKGGGALAACRVVQAPVYFIGTGEHADDFQVFDAARYLSRLMGYGDLPGLLEKIQTLQAESDFNPEDLLQEKFSLKTFYAQLEATNKIGTFDKITEMLGMKEAVPKNEMERMQKRLSVYKYLMDSMTEKERLNPDIITVSRMKRIAKGSGRTEQDVRELLKQFKQMDRMFSKMQKLNPANMENMNQQDIGKLMQKLGAGKQKKKKFRFK
ncbi:MAG: signal recognition particle receptor subunit alpha [Candidatus Diapherotrites archaeon]|nr:signal recognition particle receptor subunit alpha [Candidatus Diapherotrites archaeon]